MQASRVASRANYSEPVRIQLLEGDLDEQDSEMRAIRETLSKLLWSVIGLTISFSTAAILLGFTLARGG